MREFIKPEIKIIRFNPETDIITVSTVSKSEGAHETERDE